MILILHFLLYCAFTVLSFGLTPPLNTKNHQMAQTPPSNSELAIAIPDNDTSNNCYTPPATSATTRRDLLTRTFSITATLLAPLTPQPSGATTLDPKTGIRLPEPGEVETSIPRDWTNEENPYDSSQFARLDNTPDTQFYTDPRFVEHVDENAVRSMTTYISNTVDALSKSNSNQDFAILDLCSSWVSHIDKEIASKARRISGLGMNVKELEANPVLTDYVVQDLNQSPLLSKYEDSSFDIALCQLSIDYLTRPLEVLKEVSRILKPNGQVHILFSNRLFLSKAVSGWTGGDDIDHAYTVACYLHFSGGQFDTIQAHDLSTRSKGREQRIVGDPMYVVSARKAA